MLEGLERQAEVKVSFALDQVAVAEARIDLLALIRILADAHRNHYQGEQFHAADFRGMALLNNEDHLSATGLGVPPSDAIIRPRYVPIELNAPAWSTTTLTATGRYEPADEASSDDADRIAAARLNGVDDLRLQVERLVIQKDVTIADFLGHHDELKDDVVLFLSGTRIAREPQDASDGSVEVSVALPLERLWWIVRRGMERVEVDAPDVPTTQTTQKSTP